MAAPVIASTATATGTDTCSKPAGTAAGDLLLAFAGDVNLGAITSPGGWTEIIEGNGFTVAYKIADGSEGSSFTFGLADIVVIHRITGNAATSPIDVHGSAHNGASAAPHATAPSVTTTVADCLLVYGSTYAAGGVVAATSTPPGGYTERSDVPHAGNKHAITTADKTLTAAGSTGTAAGTWSGDCSNRTSVHVAIAPVPNLPPTAPTLVSPTDAATIYRNQTNAFDWTHNDPESDAQSAWALKRRSV